MMPENSESGVLPVASKEGLEKYVAEERVHEDSQVSEEIATLPPKRNIKRQKAKLVESDSSSCSDSETERRAAALRGDNKSGRFWKSPKKRFRTVIKTPGLINTTLEKRLALRADLKHAKELTRATVDKRNADKEAKKERRRDNMKRAEANRKKAEIIQVIKNSAKVKKMKKKQLRYIEKRDTTKIK